MKNKSRLIANVLIIFMIVVFVAVCLIVTFSYGAPESLDEVTGTIAEFNQRDDKWSDSFTNNSAYLNVTLEDGSFFVANGIAYDHIDRTLFERLRIGAEIKITYENGGFFSGPNKIYAIEYDGEIYLSLDEVLIEYEKDAKDSRVIGLAIAGGFIVISGFGLFVFNYTIQKKNTKK